MSAEPARQAEDLTPAPPERQRTRAPAPGAGNVVSLKAQAARTAAPARRRNAGRDVLRDLIEPNWALMAPVMFAAAVLTAIITGSLPGLVSLAMLVPGIAIAALTPLAARIERERLNAAAHRDVLATLLVGVPMLLFGTAMAHWTAFSISSWQNSMGILVITGSLAIIILNRRVSSITMAMVGLWSGVAAIAGTPGAYFTLAIGGTTGLYTARRQSLSDEREARADRERQRTQLRAEEILHDFEQTGQGWFWETDRRGQLAYLSPPIGDLLGCDCTLLYGRPLSDLFIPDPQGQENERTLAFHMTARSAFSELAMRAATRGEERWWSVNGRPLYDTFGNFVGFRGSGNDLTERRRSAADATRLAHYDSLTGLANRLQMAQTLEKILVAPNHDHRTCGSSCSISTGSSKSTIRWGTRRAITC